MEKEKVDLEALKRARSIRAFLEGNGVKITKAGVTEYKCCCPLPGHNDTNASFYINNEKNVYQCKGCGKSGSIIDLVVDLKGCSFSEAVDILTGQSKQEVRVKKVPATKKNTAPPKLTDTFVYRSETGKPVFFVKRFVEQDGGKTFRQGYINDKGVEILSMKDVHRVPYNLDKFGLDGAIWLAEGEKCAEALCSIGLIGTCTAGGSGGWMDAYASYFVDRDVMILPDHDEPGEKYASAALESIKNVARSVRVVRVGRPGMKKGYDVADCIKEIREDTAASTDGRSDGTEEARAFVQSLANAATQIVKGVELNILSMNSLIERHKEAAKSSSHRRLSVAKHLPSLEGIVRDFRTGDCVFIKGPTGSAKTMFAQSIARWAAPQKVLVFEIELAPEDLAARWVAMENDVEIADVADMHKGGDICVDGINHIYTCHCSNPTPQYIEQTIRNAELIIGEKPGVVIVDYIQLVRWPEKCSRYERFSNIAEYFRTLPNITRTIMIVVSQVARPDQSIKGERTPSRYDSKESGSIENSATLMLDISPGGSPSIKKITVLKDTHSSNEGKSAEVGFIGEKAMFGEPVKMSSDVF